MIFLLQPRTSVRWLINFLILRTESDNPLHIDNLPHASVVSSSFSPGLNQEKYLILEFFSYDMCAGIAEYEYEIISSPYPLRSS